MSTSSSDSDLAATSFFARPQDIAQQAIQRESRKADKQKRKNSQWVQQNELSRDGEGSSSDIMIVQDENQGKENEKKTKKRPPKEKEKEKEKKSSTLKKKKDSSTSTSTSTKTKSTSSKKKKGSHVLSSSDSELEPLPFAAPLTTHTQREKAGDELRELARKKGGWMGSTPPDRVARRRREEEEERRKRVTPESEEETSTTTRRRTSASTAATSLSSDKSHSTSSKPPPSTRLAPKASISTTNSTTTNRKRRIAPPPSRSPSPQLQPVPPVSFWNAESHQLGQKPNSTKVKVGEKSQALRTLSEQRNKIVDFGDEKNGAGEDEIRDDSSSVSEGDGRGKYETVAKREKRKRAESLGE